MQVSSSREWLFTFVEAHNTFQLVGQHLNLFVLMPLTQPFLHSALTFLLPTATQLELHLHVLLLLIQVVLCLLQPDV